VAEVMITAYLKEETTSKTLKVEFIKPSTSSTPTMVPRLIPVTEATPPPVPTKDGRILPSRSQS